MLARQALIEGDLVIFHVWCAEVGTEVGRGSQDSPGRHETQQGIGTRPHYRRRWHPVLRSVSVSRWNGCCRRTRGGQSDAQLEGPPPGPPHECARTSESVFSPSGQPVMVTPSAFVLKPPSLRLRIPLRAGIGVSAMAIDPVIGVISVSSEVADPGSCAKRREPPKTPPDAR